MPAGTDTAGNVPKTGDYVAYNQSGQIATGHIVRIGNGRRGPIYYIAQKFPEDRWRDPMMAPHESVVRGGPRCVLVLSPSQPGKGSW